MNANVYQKLAARTINYEMSDMQKEYHAIHGMASEIGEVHGLYQKVYQGHEYTEEHMKKEIGDLLWFIAEYCTAMGWKLGEVMQMNIDKLIARYPKGFEAEKSLHRAAGDV
jgi:NTP pyrophosphatase (non-canonical NTP hydrolase)